MVEFIRIQYRLGRLTAEQVRSMAPKWITADQAEEIIHMGQAERPERKIIMKHLYEYITVNAR